jgi:hypothetical protein
MSKVAVILLLTISAAVAYAQWDDGVLINVQEVNIAAMHGTDISGAEAIMKVIEQYVDASYQFAYLSQNYLIPLQQETYLNLGTNRFTVVVVGYPGMNNLLYAQVFFDKSFFFLALCKRDTDLRRTSDIQIYRMNYDKFNTGRRNNVRDTMQANNVLPLGMDKRR